MLDTDTKRRIDTARDILVGKVPDPKSQVEQITIALIYKFMDDMDAQAEELGGRRKFFAGGFARYGWAKLMRAGLGGQEVLNLYAEAIARMPENPGIPPLFRNIFRNAYLPYRDPETLKSFLKIVDDFSYDHSERLGDAFEYLLSVLGSQGDAGQFRTPRHIIDFIVEVVNPKKNETILDPACGTAGFLISSYKHIVRANSDGPKNGNPKNDIQGRRALTPDEKGRLARNLKGYDISPDMVRLSLVNLYLHGFTDPHIDEYDTLTSEEKWNQTADVILANPPFMSPKGGIKPHRRFSVQSKRSEVLFVDYIAEHLSPAGRAGIIVPEGIVFQSQNAYTQLRKMLVEGYLVAVVSLPAGIFNPYSGVKTSVLILDRSLARQSDTIGFFKVENDGFGLGAQRREIDKNDLPQVRAEVEAYLAALRSRRPTAELQPAHGRIVPKAKIAKNGDYNLSGERYKNEATTSSEFPHITLGEICEVNPETANPADLYPGSSFNYIDISCVQNDTGAFLGANSIASKEAPSRARRLVKKGDILISTVRPNLKAFAILAEVPDRAVASTGFAVLRCHMDRAVPAFLIRMLRDHNSVTQMIGMMGRGAYPSINQKEVESVQIPLPPLEVQKEIVAEIEGYQKVIDGARAVLDNYRPHIPIHPDWPMVPLGDVIDGKPKNGYSGSPVDGPAPLKVLSLSATTSGKLDTSKFKFLDENIALDSPCRCRRGDIYLQRGNTKELVGTAAMFDVDASDFIYPDLMIRIRANENKVDSYYLLNVLQSVPVREFVMRNAVGSAGNMPKINQAVVSRIPIPLPNLSVQQAIVAEIEAEQALVGSNRELITRFEKKIQATLARVWGEEPTHSTADDEDEGVPDPSSVLCV